MYLSKEDIRQIEWIKKWNQKQSNKKICRGYMKECISKGYYHEAYRWWKYMIKIMFTPIR